ncbi:hypothetical protein Poli38472_007055 [Pythium oligandrum]|uniref:Apoptosis-inducing factor 1, mitochondrial n=1 Tax=Pythium oligandrum TaxID=41045 RepID=A0A8K1C9S9_PYTOL|nr:hypothetical protein Poli38472_007055 [Pythium oligandrum]|eukprot:TMW58910.1 hypothetical protein Poli38472_007055 [Pythium oligandrum]
MWSLGRQATRAVSTLRRVKGTRRIGTSSVLLTAPLLALGTAAFALSGDEVHAQSESGRRVSPPLSKEHMRLARRFTRKNNQKFHRYVIVGCGTAAHAAIEAIRQGDPHADILILSDERALPRLESRRGGENDANFVNDALLETYNEWRRHITQKLEEDPTEPVVITGGGVLSPSPVTLLMKKNTTMHFDVEKNRILLSDGTEIQYEKCLIACSGRPRHFYVLDRERISYEIKDRINTCTTLHDFEQLDALSKRPDIKRVTIVGGGFLGTEVATALATDPRNAHLKTQLLFVEAAPGSRSLPSYLAKELARRLTSVGIDVVADRLVTSLKASTDGHDDCVAITAMGNGKHKLKSDYVVLASTHTEPNLRLDRQHCFEVDDKHGGIKVNAQLEAMAGVFVAGNAASYYDPYLGRRRVDRYDHAVNSGLLAGRNMVASGSTNHLKLYRHQPVFRSDLKGIDVQIEGIGEIDASFHTVGVWVQPTASKESPQTPAYERGVVYYLKGNKIMGILLWNAPDVMESARQFMLTRPEVHENVIDELKEAISLGPDDWLHVVST